jgi:hypothetical protein
MSGTAAPSRDFTSIAYNIGFLLVIAACAGLALAYWLNTTTRTRLAPAIAQDAADLEITISGQKLSVPPSWVRVSAQRQSGFADELDLRLPLGFEDGSKLALRATIVSPGKARTSAFMLDSVFLHQFEPRQLGGYPGLIGKPLKASSGYQGETVWYDALAFNPFVAKCVEPVSPDGVPSCQRVIALQDGGLLAMNFSQTWLSHWREFDQALAKALDRIGTAQRR